MTLTELDQLLKRRGLRRPVRLALRGVATPTQQDIEARSEIIALLEENDRTRPSFKKYWPYLVGAAGMILSVLGLFI